MAAKKVVWRNTCPRFVAFLDIMGFRDRVFRESHEKVKKMLESLHPVIEEIEKETRNIIYMQTSLYKKYFSGKTPLSTIFPVSFSDSIILFSSDDSNNSALHTVLYTSLILSEAIRKEIPIKGAIAFGEMTVDIGQSLYFGRPLIDAYDLQRELQLYGVILHHTAENQIKELGHFDDLINYSLYEHLVPMKSAKISHYLVEWSYRFQDPQTFVRKLYNNVSGKPRLYVDNTLEFVREMEKKRPSGED